MLSIKKAMFGLVLACFTWASSATDLKNYFSESVFRCMYQNPISRSVVITEYREDGSYSGTQQIQASKLGEPKMEAMVEFNGSWHVSYDSLHTQVEHYEMRPTNPLGEKLVAVMHDSAKAIDPISSIRVKVESRDQYIEASRDSKARCYRVYQ